jgi:ligand-binding sensor domain-containing protein/signal transduction histidine kinase
MFDKYNNLWIGTEEGIFIYDGAIFFLLELQDIDIQPDVQDICSDKYGNIWVASTMGLFKYEETNPISLGPEKVVHYKDGSGLPTNDVRDIFMDNNEKLWFATRGGGVSYLDGNTFHTLNMSSGMPSNYVECILQDNTGAYWFGTNGAGLTRYDGEYFEYFNEENGFLTGNVFSLTQDRSGNVWACVYGGGLVQFDGIQFVRYSETEGLNTNLVLRTLHDDSGSIWIGTDGGGLNLFQGNSIRHFTESEGLLDNGIFSIIKDSKGRFWMGSYGGGISYYDGKQFYHYTETEGLSSNIIYALYEDKKGNLWIGTNNGGVIKFDGNSFVHYTHKNGLSNNVVLSILEDKSGKLWFGTRGGGVTILNPDQTGNSGKFTHYNTKSGLSHDIIFDLHEDTKGTIWMATGSGVTCYNGTNFTHFKGPQGLSDNYVLSIMEDKKGQLWFGTMGEGVIRYNGTDFAHFTDKEGLVNNVVLSIGQDSTGSIWLGTRMGVSKLDFLEKDDQTESNEFNSKEYRFTNIVYEDGFLGTGCWRNSMYIDSKMGIIIGSNDRLTIIKPDADLSLKSRPQIKISSIELFNEAIDWVSPNSNRDTSILLGNGIKLSGFKFKGLSKWNNLPEELRLPYNHNFISFNFVGVTSSRPSDVRYQYMLEGFDDFWSAVSSRNVAHFGKLPPGRYVFKVKAASSDLIWTEAEQFSFTIRPPWWKTLPAYLFYLLIAGYFGYRVHKFQKAKTIREEREKTRILELEQAKEIEKAYMQLGAAHENLKATQAQLIQSEKMASLGELTAGIAHEIKNPLNFVNNFSEVSLELIEEVMEEVKAQGLASQQTIIEILKDIESNLRKIHEHGSRANNIVSSMLQHSRGGSGNKEPTDLNALVKEYVNLCFHGMRAGKNPINVTINLELDPEVHEVLLINEDFTRVIINLCNNAFDAMRQKRLIDPDDYLPKLSVRTKSERDCIVIEVEDNGPGDHDIENKNHPIPFLPCGHFYRILQ